MQYNNDYNTGHLYGRVAVCHVEVLLKMHIMEGRILKELYRLVLFAVDVAVRL